jgi:hypothetical protein
MNNSNILGESRFKEPHYTNTGEFVHGDKAMFGFGRHRKKIRRNNKTSRKKLKKRKTRKQ